MIIPYRFASAAEEELAKSILFYRDISPELADDFVRQLDRVIELLRRSPNLGTPTDGSLRKFPLTRFPFTIHYRIESETIVIYAVAHQSRRPGYWKSRVS